MSIGDNIYKIRKDMGLTQSEFAKKTGASQSAINYWENGKRQPRIEQIQNIAKSLNIPLEDIVANPSISTTMEFNSEKEANLYMDILKDFEKLNEKGIEELKHYASYLTTQQKYTQKEKKPDYKYSIYLEETPHQ